MSKIWGETKFQPRERPRSGSKAIDVKEGRGEREIAKVGNNNGQLSIENATSVCKPPGPIGTKLKFKTFPTEMDPAC